MWLADKRHDGTLTTFGLADNPALRVLTAFALDEVTIQLKHRYIALAANCVYVR